MSKNASLSSKVSVALPVLSQEFCLLLCHHSRIPAVLGRVIVSLLFPACICIPGKDVFVCILTGIPGNMIATRHLPFLKDGTSLRVAICHKRHIASLLRLHQTTCCHSSSSFSNQFLLLKQVKLSARLPVFGVVSEVFVSQQLSYFLPLFY